MASPQISFVGLIILSAIEIFEIQISLQSGGGREGGFVSPAPL